MKRNPKYSCVVTLGLSVVGYMRVPEPCVGVGKRHSAMEVVPEMVPWSVISSLGVRYVEV